MKSIKLKRKHTTKKSSKKSMSKIAAIASVPQYLDSNETCYDIALQRDFSAIPDNFFDSFYQTKLPIFQSFKTKKITMTS